MSETFKELGKKAAIDKLYEDTPFKACINPWCETREGYAVTSSRLLLEGIDFNLDFFPLKHLGRKAVVQVSGELFSCLAHPRTLKVTIGLSAKLDFPQVKEIWTGIAAAAEQFGYRSVALDIVPSLTGLSLCVCATGTDENRVKRPIAKSMDLICISDNAGAAFLGESIMQKAAALDEKSRSKKLEQYRQLVGAYLHPELSPFVLKALEESKITPSFGYFCSESLRDTILNLCHDSGLGAKIYVDKLPLAGGSVDASKELNLDPLQAALKGGDDNCLLFTIPIGSHDRFRRDFQQWDIIGHLAKPEVGAVLVSPDGLEHGI